MTVDPLYILLMIEAILILTALLIFLARRPAPAPAAAISEPAGTPPAPAEPTPDPDVIPRSLMLGMLEENIKEIEKKAGLGQEKENPESQGLLLDQVYSLNLDLLKNMDRALRAEGANPVDSLSESLTVNFRVSVNERLLSFVRALEEQPASADQPEAFDPASPTNRQLARETYDRLQENFENVVTLNREIKEQILHLQGEEALSAESTTVLTENMEQMNAFIGELENSNRELELCVNTLERANDELLKRIAELEKKE